MTKREREFASLGFEYAEGIERSSVVRLESGREVRRVGDKWEVQPPFDNYWKSFDDLLDAIRFGMGK